MQEIHHDHSMTERKVPRPHHHQILKCPRCESLNTKFCYYNNYNLSQPRHFCKGCRRYWTKGGLLRNINVGSGSRKPKRSINKNTTAPPEPLSTQPPPPPPPPEPQSSSGGSSTLTESTSKMFAADQGGGGGVFNEAESFTTSSMSSTNEAIDHAFGFGNSSNIPDIPDTSSFWDGEFGSLDWQGSGDDQGLIDLSDYSVDDDDQFYWTHTQWSHQDNPSLFHLP